MQKTFSLIVWLIEVFVVFSQRRVGCTICKLCRHNRSLGVNNASNVFNLLKRMLASCHIILIYQIFSRRSLKERAVNEGDALELSLRRPGFMLPSWFQRLLVYFLSHFIGALRVCVSLCAVFSRLFPLASCASPDPH